MNHLAWQRWLWKPCTPLGIPKMYNVLTTSKQLTYNKKKSKWNALPPNVISNSNWYASSAQYCCQGTRDPFPTSVVPSDVSAVHLVQVFACVICSYFSDFACKRFSFHRTKTCFVLYSFSFKCTKDFAVFLLW